jgi:hypothetical protein
MTTKKTQLAQAIDWISEHVLKIAGTMLVGGIMAKLYHKYHLVFLGYSS